MQRRAAAVYVAFFVIIAAASYAFIGAAEEPAIEFDDPDVSTLSGENFTVGDTEYAVEIAEIESEGGLEGGGEEAGPGAPVEATISWGDGEQRVVSEGEVFTLGGTDYVAHFPDQETMVLSSDVQSYNEQVDDRQEFQNRITGINYLAGISLFAALLLITMAYLPRRS